MCIDLPVKYCNVLNVKIRQNLKKGINGSSHSWQNKTQTSQFPQQTWFLNLSLIYAFKAFKI